MAVPLGGAEAAAEEAEEARRVWRGVVEPGHGTTAHLLSTA